MAPRLQSGESGEKALRQSRQQGEQILGTSAGESNYWLRSQANNGALKEVPVNSQRSEHSPSFCFRGNVSASIQAAAAWAMLPPAAAVAGHDCTALLQSPSLAGEAPLFTAVP